jgi:endonuclease-3
MMIISGPLTIVPGRGGSARPKTVPIVTKPIVLPKPKEPAAMADEPIETAQPKRKQKVRKAWTIEKAKSGRSRCVHCKELIEKGAIRLGVLTFYPHRNCRWHHFSPCMNRVLLGATLERVWGLSEFDAQFQETLDKLLTAVNAVAITKSMPSIVGDMDMPRFATALTTRYNRFRSFRFGLPEAQMYTKNWNWRCFLATMLVCNTHETAMLAVTDKLFKVYSTPEKLAAIEQDRTTQKAWKDWMDGQKLRHSGKKMAFILRANRKLLKEYDGEIPNDRDALQEMNGVGRHVASVTMAWVHQAPEFGIDTHVSRILKRWGYIEEGMDEELVEMIVKRTIPEKQIGHFSRAFVDHGQQVCGFTPDCQNCYLRASCPTARKYADLDW